MSEQLLHSNDIGAFGKETRRESMAQRVPRHSFEPRLFAGQFKSGLKIAKAITRHLVEEHIGTFPHGAPSFENTIGRIVQRYDEHPSSLLNECTQPPPIKIHLLPLQIENITAP